MKIEIQNPPRNFEVGFDNKTNISDCGTIVLNSNEQITFKTSQGGEYDVTRKSWGFYATPSTNGRLPRFGFKTVLVKNRLNQHFVMLVEKGHESEFENYAMKEPLTIVAWLDNSKDLEKISKEMCS
jgi:hypothetical protein